jgi:hypothetical protein
MLKENFMNGLCSSCGILKITAERSVSETGLFLSNFRKVLLFSSFRIPDDEQSPKNLVILSVIHRRQSPLEYTANSVAEVHLQPVKWTLPHLENRD